MKNFIKTFKRVVKDQTLNSSALTFAHHLSVFILVVGIVFYKIETAVENWILTYFVNCWAIIILYYFFKTLIKFYGFRKHRS